MSLKSDRWIKKMAYEHDMISPFVAKQTKIRSKKRVISYGLSSYGYDVCLAREFKIFTNIKAAIVDPKNFSRDGFVDVKADECVIPPNSLFIRTWKDCRIF